MFSVSLSDQVNAITVWISTQQHIINAYAYISFESTSDAGKGVMDLKTSLQNIFADNLAETKDDFLKTFPQKISVSNGKILQPSVNSKGLKDSNADELGCVLHLSFTCCLRRGRIYGSSLL